MPYKPTEKVNCKTCGGWVAEVNRRTGRVVRVRNAHRMPPPEENDPDGDDVIEYDADGEVTFAALADETPVYGRAWCAECSVFVRWVLGSTDLRR